MQLLSVRTRTALWVTFAFLAGTCAAVLTGCKDEGPSTSESKSGPQNKRPIRVVIVDDAPLAEALERQWSARTEGELELQQMSAEELDSTRRLRADIVIYPSSCLGTLASRKLITSHSESTEIDAKYGLQDVFELQRNAEVRWGSKSYAYSFGSPQLVLMYRADLFAKWELQPPKTWGEYQKMLNAVAVSRKDDATAGDQPWSAVCEPLAPGWAAKMLLARAAGYASHPSQFSVLFHYSTMDPLIAGPPFVKALEELVAANKLGPEDASELTPEQARRRLLAGETAVAVSWPSRAAEGGDEWQLADGAEIAFAELPGSESAYNFGEKRWTPHESDQPVSVPLIGVAGRLGSVTQNARRPLDAARILELLTGKEWSELLSPLSSSTTMFRSSQLAKPELWTDSVLTPESARNYAEVIEVTQSKPLRVSSIRIPGARRYLEALDQAVYAALAGEKSAQDALSDAAQQWSTITDELGLDTQREAYTRSLGMDR